MKAYKWEPWALAPILLVLAACSTPKGTSTGSTNGIDDARTARSTPAAARRGGGYYLDDGPGDDAPADLASIPDAVPRAEPLLARTLRPYSVFGRQYTPMSSLAPYRARGMASWYGKRYHGQPTSSGERYDMYAMSAAHPTLPIPSYVRVTRVRDGRSVVVRVNDRGPFLQSRVIDLSYTAAAKLGFVEAGSAEVEVELITQFDAQPRVVVATVPDAAPAAMPALPPAPMLAPMPALAPALAPAPAPAPAPAAEVQRLTVETTLMGTETPLPERPGPVPLAAAHAPALRGAMVATTDSAPESASAAATVAPDRRGFWLQLGAFASLDSAQRALDRFASELVWLGARFDLRRDGALYKVQAGPWTHREQALDAAERVRAATALRPFATFR